MKTRQKTHRSSTAGSGREPLLWTVQALLALLYVFAGVTKLLLPAAELTAAGPLPAPFLRLIGVFEVLGAAGLILPGLLRIRRDLTPLAARGLVIIMSGAVGVTLASGAVLPALFPAVPGVLAALVAHGRREWNRPVRPSSARHHHAPGRAGTPLADAA
ncbi:MAG TPA: DoxX family protein [Longimicrobiales bacterium]|jgi:uncharacterized membrane protein YphA (DoxX/SURF4 family)|nr:DoxX family protein [Longimicrobiales bacterium]